MTLAEIVKVDFLKSVLEQYGIDEERLKLFGYECKNKLVRLAEINRQEAVCRYLATDTGRQELLTALNDLENVHETARLHLVANLLARKVKCEATDQMLKLKPDTSVQLFVVMGMTDFGYDDLKKGIAIFKEASDKTKILKNMECLVDALLQNPNFIADLIGKLNQADKLFHDVIPGHKFPPNDQIQAGAEIISSMDWTPAHSMRYYLEQLQKTLGGE
jgi:hypothetical protein